MLKQTALALCATVVFALPASANIVTNPGFETGDFTGWEQVNDTSFSGVICDAFGGEVPPEGECQAFFGPVDPSGGGIIQTLTTVAGASYDISFMLANLGNPPNAFGLFWDGGFFSIDFDLAPFPYLTGSVTLEASSAATDIGFIFFHEPSFFLLDDISVTIEEVDVPAPGALLPLFAGLALLGARAASRRTA